MYNGLCGAFYLGNIASLCWIFNPSGVGLCDWFVGQRLHLWLCMFKPSGLWFWL